MFFQRRKYVDEIISLKNIDCKDLVTVHETEDFPQNSRLCLQFISSNVCIIRLLLITFRHPTKSRTTFPAVAMLLYILQNITN
jgi:hypothetical protein